MISRQRWARLKPILEPALQLPPEEVPAYLDRACGGDARLREDAKLLLRACEQGRRSLEFLDSPAAELAAPLLELERGSLETPEALEPGATVGPYTIERCLGRGGMGVVYLADDRRLDRKVALKLLPPWLAMDEAAKRRFVQEAKAASRLDHPNIETVYEIGETTDGRLYIAMAYYAGETLQERILRGPLEIDSALDLACQMAEGLAAAHAHGIVHRDIKPSNAIVTPEGVAKIVDFGAAKIAGHQLTISGAALGTVAYMSPEQTRREDPDGRTDIWSLGAVLYEMLTGRRPFPARHRDAVIYAIRNDEPKPLSQLRPDVPEPLARLVQRCLEKDPNARYQAAASLAKALRQARQLVSGAKRRAPAKRRVLRLLGTTALIAAILVGASILWPRMGAEDTPPGAAGEAVLPATIGLAVLPLADSSPDAQDAYFADGLTEELISGLSRREDLRVTALASVMSYRDTQKSYAEIGQELGVGAVLAGSVRKLGDRVRLSVQLLDTGSQERLWVRDYDAEIGNLLSVRQDIARRVVEALPLRVRAREERHLARPGTENADAYTEYLKGRYFLGKLDAESFSEARDHFGRSLDLDPTFARAWSGLAEAYNHLTEVGFLPATEGYPRVRAAAERALELDPDLAEAHAALAMALAQYYWDTEGAERHFRRALELDPSAARSHRLYAVHLRNLGRFEEALGEVRKAQELDPLSAFSHIEEGRILYLAGRYEEAIGIYEQLLRSIPDYTLTQFWLGLAFAQTGQYEEALAALRNLDPYQRPDVPAVRGYVYGRMGRQDEARQMIAMLDDLSKARWFLSFQKAAIHVALGEHEQALDLLELAAEERPWQMRLLNVEPIFAPLRSEPRFQALLEQVNLTG